MNENISELMGKTLTRIEGAEKGSEEILFITDTCERFKMFHDQDCCEFDVDDICGDIDDLIGSPITMAEEVSSENAGKKDEYHDSFTWTFYKLATVKGYVTLKWYGTSSGYYSEDVTFEKMA